MDLIDALNDLKRLKRKCKEFCNELHDFKRLVNDKDGLDSRYQEFLQFILDNAEMDRDDKRKREDTTYIDEEDEYDEEDDPKYEQRNDSQNTLEHEGHRDHEDQPDKRNKILQIQIKVEGQKAGTSNLVSEKLRNPAQQSVKSKIQTQRKLPEAFLLDEGNEDNSQSGPCCNQADLPGPREPSKGSHRSKAGTSNPVSEKLYEKAKGHKQRKFKEVNEDQQVKKKVGHVSEKAGASNSVPEKLCDRSCPAQQGPKSKRQKKGEFKEVDEDQPVKKNKILQIQIKVEEKTGTSNPVSKKMSERAPPSQLGLKAKSKKKMKSPKVIQIDDDDEDIYIPSGQKDKGKIVVSEIPEVEILDNAAFSKQGILSPFVPSKRYHENLSDESVETLAFRNDVLKVLREPYDQAEYNRLYKEFAGGSYLFYYEDVTEKLHSFHRREKRLVILRGFFFWIQNLSREGAFRPWTDPACLEAVAGKIPWK